ncbi:hypothetical protein Taro_028422, partial [Colocasia esculenta]|nr:hypothetical protein [Colocasia esculenta]
VRWRRGALERWRWLRLLPLLPSPPVHSCAFASSGAAVAGSSVVARGSSPVLVLGFFCLFLTAYSRGRFSISLSRFEFVSPGLFYLVVCLDLEIYSELVFWSISVAILGFPFSRSVGATQSCFLLCLKGICSLTTRESTPVLTHAKRPWLCTSVLPLGVIHFASGSKVVFLAFSRMNLQ